MQTITGTLSEEWKDQLPTECTDEAHQRRQALFREYFDRNGNGFCSLAECDAGIKDLLPNCSMFTSPVILRAFQISHSFSDRKGSNVDFLEFSEFRIFLSYLKEYALLGQLFDQIDSEEEQDRRISRQEFLLAYSKLVSDYGFRMDDSADAIFSSIDANGGGYILFAEFVEWAMQQKKEGKDE